MKKIFFWIVFFALLTLVPVSSKADVDVHIGIPLPPAIIFSAPPVTVVIPETYIYAVPDVPQDIFFYGGWWWRPWEERWYRAPHYDRGWAYYNGVPAFYRHVPPRWRDDYRNRHWKGHPWNHQRVPAHQLQGNWRGWEKDKHWEKQQHWGVPAMKPRKGAPPPRSVQPPPRPVQRDMHGPQPRPEQREMNRNYHQPGPPQQKEKHSDHQMGQSGKGDRGNGHGHGRDQ